MTKTSAGGTEMGNDAFARPDPLPLIAGPWQPLDADDSADFLVRPRLHLLLRTGADLLAQHRVEGQRCAVPPFYAGFLLVTGLSIARMGDQLVAGAMDTLLAPGFIAALDGSSALIHSINSGRLLQAPGQPAGAATSPLGDLRRPNAGLAYLRFFTAAVRAEGGAFRIVERECELSRCGAQDSSGKAARVLRPIQLLGRQRRTPRDKFALRARANVYHAGCLFRTDFGIEPGGGVEMLDDVTIASDLGPPEIHTDLMRNVVPLNIDSD